MSSFVFFIFCFVFYIMYFDKIRVFSSLFSGMKGQALCFGAVC